MKLVGADRRGSGANEAARGDAPSSKVLIDDACRMIERERLSDRPLYLVGWCWGAVLAMGLAAELSGAWTVSRCSPPGSSRRWS